jgi:hypothetical protein
MCDTCRKVLHVKRSGAKAELRRFQRSERKEGPRPGHLSVYRCPVLDGWHVGHDRYRQATAGPATRPVIRPFVVTVATREAEEHAFDSQHGTRAEALARAEHMRAGGAVEVRVFKEVCRLKPTPLAGA